MPSDEKEQDNVEICKNIAGLRNEPMVYLYQYPGRELRCFVPGDNDVRRADK
jgi:hypothetical protein